MLKNFGVPFAILVAISISVAGAEPCYRHAQISLTPCPCRDPTRAQLRTQFDTERVTMQKRLPNRYRVLGVKINGNDTVILLDTKSTTFSQVSAAAQSTILVKCG